MYSYKHGFSGFAAMLTDSQAKKLAGKFQGLLCEGKRKFLWKCDDQNSMVSGMRGILGVTLSHTVRGSTTRSFDFLGLSFNSPPSQLLHKARLGEDVIVGVIDSGIIIFYQDIVYLEAIQFNSGQEYGRNPGASTTPDTAQFRRGGRGSVKQGSSSIPPTATGRSSERDGTQRGLQKKIWKLISSLRAVWRHTAHT